MGLLRYHNKKWRKEMKIIQTAVEVSGEGFEALLGKTVIVFCFSYIYHGKLVGVNTTCIKLEDPSIIYSTGDFSQKEYSDKQKLGVKEHYIQLTAVESFGLGK
jgi:hypothetical protein